MIVTCNWIYFLTGGIQSDDLVQYYWHGTKIKTGNLVTLLKKSLINNCICYDICSEYDDMSKTFFVPKFTDLTTSYSSS